MILKWVSDTLIFRNRGQDIDREIKKINALILSSMENIERLTDKIAFLEKEKKVIVQEEEKWICVYGSYEITEDFLMDKLIYDETNGL